MYASRISQRTQLTTHICRCVGVVDRRARVCRVGATATLEAMEHVLHAFLKQPRAIAVSTPRTRECRSRCRSALDNIRVPTWLEPRFGSHPRRSIARRVSMDRLPARSLSLSLSLLFSQRSLQSRTLIFDHCISASMSRVRGGEGARCGRALRSKGAQLKNSDSALAASLAASHLHRPQRPLSHPASWEWTQASRPG